MKKIQKVVIQGFKMPGSCAYCPIVDDGLAKSHCSLTGCGTLFWNGEGYVGLTERLSSCPLKIEYEWIPVEEGLPLTEDMMEVTILDENGDTPYRYTSVGWYWDDTGWWVVDNERRCDIIAWKPLSDPWEGRK